MNFQTGAIYLQHQMWHVHCLLMTGIEISMGKNLSLKVTQQFTQSACINKNYVSPSYSNSRQELANQCARNLTVVVKLLN